MEKTRLILGLAAALTACLPATAQVTSTIMSGADAFLCTGSPSNPELGGADLSGANFGAAGTVAVVSAASSKGEFQGVVRFDTTAGATLFNATYGTNHWFISSLSLELRSNYGTAGVQPNNGIFPVIHGGQFVIEWLSDDDWMEGTGTPNLPTADGVTFNSIPTLLSVPHEILGTSTYIPPGTDISVIYNLPLTTNLVTDIAGGGPVSFLFRAADDQIAYLFNSHEFGRNQPLLHVTAAPLLKILSGTFTNGGFLLNGTGGTNATYQVQTSANLSATGWNSIGSATTDTNGLFHFFDSNAISADARFYRLSQ